MFKTNELIVDHSVAKPEEIFIASIISMIYSCEVDSEQNNPKQPRKKLSKKKTISELIKISLKIMHHDISPKWTKNLPALKNKLLSKLIHPLFQLNEASLDFCRKCLSGETTKPDFVSNLDQETNQKSQHSLKTPFILTKKYIETSM